jgi:hypothetical protein
VIINPFDEVVKHSDFIVYCTNMGTAFNIEMAGQYLDSLAEDDEAMYNRVMARLEQVYGISWQAIKDSR